MHIWTWGAVGVTPVKPFVGRAESHCLKKVGRKSEKS